VTEPLLTGQPEFLQPYRAAQKALPALARRTDLLAAAAPDARALILSRRRLAREWEQWAAPLLRQSPTSRPAVVASLASQRRGKYLFDRYRAATDHLLAHLDEQRQDDLAASLATLTRLNELLGWLFAGAIGLGLLLGWRTTRAVRRPLRMLERAADAIGRGDLTRFVSVQGACEFVHLAARLDAMRAQLQGQRALTALLGSTLQLHEIYPELATQVRALAPVDRFSLAIVADDESVVRVAYAAGVGADKVEHGALPPLDEAVRVHLARTGECLIREDLAALSPDALSEGERGVQADGLRASAVIPLLAEGRLVGALALWSVHPGAYTPDTLAPILVVSPLITAALRNAHTHARAAHYAHEAGARARELAASEGRLRTILAQMPNGVMVVDALGRVMLTSDATARIMGPASSELSSSEQGGLPFVIRDPATGLPLPPEATATGRALAGETVRAMQFTFRRPDETDDRWLEATAAPLHDDEGQITGAVSIFSDVTAQMLLSRRAAASEERLRAVYAAMACAVMVVDDAGMVVEANAAATRLLGVAGPDLVGRTLAQVTGPSIRDDGSVLPVNERPVGSALSSGIPVRGALFGLTRLDGARRWVQADAVPLFDEDGGVRQVVASFVDVTARQETEQALHREREWLRVVLDTVDAGIVACDADGVLTLFNRASRDFHGLPLTALPAGEWAAQYDLYQSDGHTPMRTEDIPLVRALTGERVRDVEMMIAPRSGEGRALLANGQAIYDAQGGKIGAVVAMHDITARKQAEEHLRRQLAFTTTVTASLGEGLLVLDDRGCVTVMNPAAERLLGWTEAALHGAALHDMIHFQHADGTPAPVEDCALLSVLRSGTSVTVHEDAFTRRDGTIMPVAYTSAPIVTAGQVVGAVLVFQDITERLRVEQAVRVSEAHYRLLAENAADLISRHAPDGAYLYVSPSSRPLLGYDPAEMIGRSIEEFIHPDDRDLAARRIDDALHAGAGTLTVTHRFQHKDGHAVWCEMTGRIVRESAAGAVVEVQFATRDITARKEAEEALRTSEQRLRAIIANAPLSIVALDADGVYTLSDGAALARLGRAPGALVGQSIFEVYRARPDLAEQARRALAGEEVAFSARLGDGAYESHMVPLRDAEGRVTSVIGVSYDVTARVAAEEALAAREARYRALTEHGHDLVCILWDDGSIRYESPSWRGVLGQSLATVYAQHGTVLSTIHPDDHAAVRAAFARLAALDAPAETLEWRLRAADGSWRTLECIATSHRDDPAIGGIVITNRDITARLEAAEVMRLSEQRFRTLVERAPVGACITDEHGVFEIVNDAYAALYGYTKEELEGQPFSLLFSPEQRGEAAALLAAYPAAARTTESEYEVVGKSGEPVTILATTVPLSGPHGGVKRATFAIDITERKRGEQRLTRLAHHDALTGLPNRALFHDRLEQALAGARREGQAVALLFLDLDGFKEVNDALGHEAGDLLLRTVAQRLRDCTRASDTVARLGGDEFTVILPAIGSRVNAARVARAMIDAVGLPVILEGGAAAVTTSIGISFYPGDEGDGQGKGQEEESLLKEADRAMYQAKRQGKNVYVFASDSAEDASSSDIGRSTGGQAQARVVARRTL